MILSASGLQYVLLIFYEVRLLVFRTEKKTFFGGSVCKVRHRGFPYGLREGMHAEQINYHCRTKYKRLAT